MEEKKKAIKERESMITSSQNIVTRIERKSPVCCDYVQNVPLPRLKWIAQWPCLPGASDKFPAQIKQNVRKSTETPVTFSISWNSKSYSTKGLLALQVARQQTFIYLDRAEIFAQISNILFRWIGIQIFYSHRLTGPVLSTQKQN